MYTGYTRKKIPLQKYLGTKVKIRADHSGGYSPWSRMPQGLSATLANVFPPWRESVAAASFAVNRLAVFLNGVHV